MKRASVDDVESLAYRVLEWSMMTLIALLFLAASPFVLFAGLDALGNSGIIRRELVGGLLYMMIAFGIFFSPLLFLVALVIVIFVAVTIGSTVYFDAKVLETADIDWQPNPAVFGLLAFFFPPVALYYLYKRHEHVVDWVDTSRWGGLAAVTLVLSMPLVLTALVLEIALIETTKALILASFASILIAPFPYAIYRDSTYVRLNSDTWHPNPGLTLSVAFATMFLLPPSYLLFGGYYLYKRRQALRAA